MTLNKLASAIAKLEGKKSQTSIGNIRETLRILCELAAGTDEVSYCLGEAVEKIKLRLRRLARAASRRSKR